MSDFVTLNGVPPYDGRYPLDLEGEPLTTTEWGWVKRRAGYLPLTLTPEAFADPELIAVLAAIAVRRAGTVDDRDIDAFLDRLFAAPFGDTITMQTDGEGDADPPPPSSDAKPNSNGDSSPTGSETSDGPPAATGPRHSDTSASAPAMSVT